MYLNYLYRVSCVYECCSVITCRLVDKCGKLISPYAPGAISYMALLTSGVNHCSVELEGYIAIYSGEERVSPPIPFCIQSSFRLSAPKSSTIAFKVASFHAWAIACRRKQTPGIGKMKLLISVETIVSSRKSANLIVPQVDSSLHINDRVCINTIQICDSIRTHSECCICCKNALLQAEISQYNTIADGLRRTFINSDELKEYGGYGILSPDEVSYFNVFVNGVLQPPKNYILKKGILKFITQDIPSKDQTVIILFVTWRNSNGHIMDSIHWQYSAVSNGSKKIYTNEDAFPEYESRGIPSPDKVSFYNLYINGVLQPRTNYYVKKGILELTTEDAPTKGSLVILESVVIRDLKEHLLRIESFEYNAHSNGGKVYTDHDEIHMYGMGEMMGPEDSSYQNLFVNGVLQPHVNYRVMRQCIVLETEDSPTVAAPITLQSITSPPAIPYCQTRLSDAAFAELRKAFWHIKNFDDLNGFDDFDH